MRTGRPPTPREVRFWPKVDRSGGPDACWPWLGTRIGPLKDPEKRYGQFFDGGKRRAAKVSWELAHSVPFPADKFACHTCDYPPCVNPAHIYPGTPLSNMADKVARGRHRFGPPPRITGEAHYRAWISDGLRETILVAVRTKTLSQMAASRQFGVPQSTIASWLAGVRGR